MSRSLTGFGGGQPLAEGNAIAGFIRGASTQLMLGRGCARAYSRATQNLAARLTREAKSGLACQQDCAAGSSARSADRAVIGGTGREHG
jgi:hypothetical protein